LDAVDAGVSVMLKSGAPVIEMIAVPLAVRPPPTPVTVKVVFPVPVNRLDAALLAGAASLLFTTSSVSITTLVAMLNGTVEPDAVAVGVPKVATAFTGRLDAERVIGELKPPVSVIVTV